MASPAPLASIAIDGAEPGDIIVVDGGEDNVYRVTPAGVVSEFLSNADIEDVFGGGVDLEGGIWFDSDGNFYLTDEDSDAVAKFPSVDSATGAVDPAGAVILSEADVLAAFGGGADYKAGAVFVSQSGFTEDSGFANDIIDGGEGNDTIIADNGTSGSIPASATNALVVTIQ